MGAVVAASQQITCVIDTEDGRTVYYRRVRKQVLILSKCLRVEGVPSLFSISSYLSTNISRLFSVWAPIGLDRSRNVAGLERSRVFGGQEDKERDPQISALMVVNSAD